MSKATSNAHDWHCEEHDTYGWRGEACRKCPTAASEITTLREQVEKLEALVVMRCDLDVPPQFSQGLQSHEVLDPVTAEHCQWFVAKIEKLTKERDDWKCAAEANHTDDAGNLIAELRVQIAAAQRESKSVAMALCRWKCGSISGDELAAELFAVFASDPSIEATQGKEGD